MSQVEGQRKKIEEILNLNKNLLSENEQLKKNYFGLQESFKRNEEYVKSYGLMTKDVV